MYSQLEMEHVRAVMVRWQNEHPNATQAERDAKAAAILDVLEAIRDPDPYWSKGEDFHNDCGDR